MSYLERNRVVKYKYLSDLVKKWQFFIFLPPEFISQIHMIMAFNDNTAMIATKDNMVYGFGLNENGQLGISNLNDSFQLRKVKELCGKNIKTFCCYNSYSPVFALTEEGKIYSWGFNKDRNLGLELESEIYLPTKVNINEECIDIACSSDHAIALTKSGKIYTWGNKNYQQLHNQARVGLPYQVKFDWKTEAEKIISIACGVMFNVVITNNGKVYSWGFNGGRLGLGHYEKKSFPCLISSLIHVRIVKIVCGAMHTLALTAEGEVYFWGIELVTKRVMDPFKMDMSKIGKVSDIAAQDNLGAAFDENGNVFIWGKYFNQKVSFITQFWNIRQVILQYSNMFKHNWAESNQNIITHDQFSYIVYKTFLEYLYTGIIDLSSEKVLELLQLADAYDETNLKENCVSLIKQTIMVSNVAMIYEKAIQYNSKELEEICFQYALNHLTDVVQTESFINLDEDMKNNFIIKTDKVGAFKK